MNENHMDQLKLSRMDRKKIELRNRIIDTTVSLIKTRGYDGTTMEQIAAETDIAKKTLYNYYPEKEAIISDYIQRTFAAKKPIRLPHLQTLPDTRARVVYILNNLMDGVRAQKEIFEKYLVYIMKQVISFEPHERRDSGIAALIGAVVELGIQEGQGEETAINGTWEQGPGDDFFNKMLKAFRNFPIIAEDLGFLSEAVVEAIKEYKFPGMKILLFAFDSDDANPYLPHNHIKNCIVYTGTHDNNTAKGWFKHEATEPIKQKMLEVLGEEPTLDSIANDLCWLAMESVANTAILPMQDILGLDETARMNVPGVVNGNWQWRLLASQMSNALAGQLAKLTKETKRI